MGSRVSWGFVFLSWNSLIIGCGISTNFGWMARNKNSPLTSKKKIISSSFHPYDIFYEVYKVKVPSFNDT